MRYDKNSKYAKTYGLLKSVMEEIDFSKSAHHISFTSNTNTLLEFAGRLSLGRQRGLTWAALYWLETELSKNMPDNQAPKKALFCSHSRFSTQRIHSLNIHPSITAHNLMDGPSSFKGRYFDYLIIDNASYIDKQYVEGILETCCKISTLILLIG